MTTASLSLADLPGGEGYEAPEEPESSWSPVDLTPYIEGTYVPLEPTVMRRSDGRCLLYPGRVHSFHGESESGKSLAAQAVAAEVLIDGGSVLYVDFEDSADGVVPRLLAMGVRGEVLRERFTYIAPDIDLHDPLDRAAWDAVLARTRTFAVVDGVTEATALVTSQNSGLEERVIEFSRLLPSRISKATGAAVVQVDHVTKNAETRGRFMIGSQHKMSRLTGPAYVVDVIEPLGDGLRGVIEFRVAKDRPGRVRPFCGPFRKSDRTQQAALMTFDSTAPGVISVTVGEPLDRVGGQAKVWRPTQVMEQASRHLESMKDSDGVLVAQSENQLLPHLTGKTDTKRQALDSLVAGGFVRRWVGARNSKMHALVKVYRAADDNGLPWGEVEDDGFDL